MYKKKKTIDDRLLRAVKSNNLERVKELLSPSNGLTPIIHVEIDLAYPSAGQTPLYIAVKNNNYEITKLLLEKGANPNLPYEIAKLLLEKGANPNLAEYKEGKTPLIVAIQNKDTRTVQLLLEKGADANIAYGKGVGITPIDEATKQPNKLEMVNLLIKHGANPYQNTAALVSAVHVQDVPLVTELLKAKPEKGDFQMNENLLSKISGPGDLKILKLLFEEGQFSPSSWIAVLKKAIELNNVNTVMFLVFNRVHIGLSLQLSPQINPAIKDAITISSKIHELIRNPKEDEWKKAAEFIKNQMNTTDVKIIKFILYTLCSYTNKDLFPNNLNKLELLLKKFQYTFIKQDDRIAVENSIFTKITKEITYKGLPRTHNQKLEDWTQLKKLYTDGLLSEETYNKFKTLYNHYNEYSKISDDYLAQIFYGASTLVCKGFLKDNPELSAELKDLFNLFKSILNLEETILHLKERLNKIEELLKNTDITPKQAESKNELEKLNALIIEREEKFKIKKNKLKEFKEKFEEINTISHEGKETESKIVNDLKELTKNVIKYYLELSPKVTEEKTFSVISTVLVKSKNITELEFYKSILLKILYPEYNVKGELTNEILCNQSARLEASILSDESDPKAIQTLISIFPEVIVTSHAKKTLYKMFADLKQKKPALFEELKTIEIDRLETPAPEQGPPAPEQGPSDAMEYQMGLGGEGAAAADFAV